MVDKQVNIKVTTETDTGSLEDLADFIDNLSDTNLNVEVDADGLNEAGAGADELADGLSNADNEAQNLGNDLGILEAGALMSISEQVGQLGDEAEGMAQDMNSASITVGQLATQTGIAEPQMVSLINNISNATFPNDEAMMYVKSLDQIGVSSQNLGQSATDLDHINDAFGLGAQTTNSLGQELSVLGVDMNNVSTSFNALAYANANTVGGMDNYYNFLRKYDAQFHELGFNVDQASVIIAGATQKFGGGRAALSGLSDALKEFNGDTRALEQALGLEAGSIDNATKLTGEYEGQLMSLCYEEAEHKTWLDQLNAAWEDMSLSLSPILSPLASFMGLIGQAGSLAVGINGLVQLAQTTRVAAAAQWLLNASIWANPITWLVLAIIALIAVLGYLYFNNEQVRQAIDGLGQAFMWAGQIIYSSIVDAVNWVIGALQNLWTYIITLGGLLPENVSITGNQIIDTILRVLAFIATLPLQLGMIFINMIAKTLGFGDNFVQNMIRAGSKSVSNFIGYISSLPSRLLTELNNMLSAVGQWASTLPQKFWEAGVNAVKNFLHALGIASPGIMQRTLVWEISEMGKRVPDEGRRVLTNITDLAGNIVDNFGSPELSFGLNTDDIANTRAIDSNEGNMSGNGVINLTLNIDSVDSEDRIQEIVDIIRRELSWNNKTAGRSV